MTAERFTEQWYIDDAARMKAERESKGLPPIADEIERLKTNADPATMHAFAALSTAEETELTEETPLNSDTSVNSAVVPLLDRDRTLVGLVGRYVRTLEPHTEADAAGLLVDFLVAFGNLVGSGPHMIADGAAHPARLFALFVGRSARGRKGTIRAQGRSVFAAVDQDWSRDCIKSGVGSGEGIITAVADTEDRTVDKRLLVVEPEFSRLLAVAERSGSIVSAVLRDAWDTGDLSTLTRNPLSAHGAHVSMIGHIVRDELRERLTSTDVANGFANRFAFVYVDRSKLLPEGGNPDDLELHALCQQIRTTAMEARKVGRMARTQEASERWSDIYAELAEAESGGLIDAVTARAEAQVLRLSVAFALTDVSKQITLGHLEAAYAVWKYCHASAAYIFGDATGNPIADTLRSAVQRAGEPGLNRTEVHALFARSVTADRLNHAVELLIGRGFIVERKDADTGGRPRQILVSTETKKANQTKKVRAS